MSNKASHVSGLGPSFVKIWTCGRSPPSGSRNAWTRIKNFNGASRLRKFWNFSARSKWFPVGRDGWPWTKPGYITTVRRQSNNQWSGGIVAHCKNPLDKFLPWFLGSRWHPPHWLSSKVSNYRHGVLLIPAGANEGHFEGKTPWGHKGGLVLAWQCSGSLGTCNPEETGLPGLPVSWSPTLFSGSGPVGLLTVPWTEKNNWKVAIFRPTWRSLLLWRPGWTDNLLNFFCVACKS